MAQQGFNLASRGVIRAIFDEPVTELRVMRKPAVTGSSSAVLLDAVRNNIGPRAA
jgi:hypothetical protein